MSYVVTSEKSGVALGEYERTAPCIRLEQGKPWAGMKRPLDLAPGEQTVVDYPLDGHAKGEPRTLVCVVRRVDETIVVGVDAAKPGSDMTIRSTIEVSGQSVRVLDAKLERASRPRVVEVEQPARNVEGPSSTFPGQPQPFRVDPKPPAKVDAPPASATRRRAVRKTT